MGNKMFGNRAGLERENSSISGLISGLRWFSAGLFFFALMQGWGWPPDSVSGRPIILETPPVHINDGDTFEADLNGNGRLDYPGERVRLLYVDTPELKESRKGQDMRHGLPAREFLKKALSKPPITLLPNPLRKYDNYGRMLAVIRAGGQEVNLELIRQGHSYFDTRFSFPATYDEYADAEAEAFQARRGIWSTEKSRQSYLKRLKKELKTPRSPDNPLFIKGPHFSRSLNPSALAGKFIRVQGRLKSRKILRKGLRLLFLPGPKGDPPLKVFVGKRVNRKLSSDSWPEGAMLHLDGFVKIYKKQPELVLHYGRMK